MRRADRQTRGSAHDGVEGEVAAAVLGLGLGQSRRGDGRGRTIWQQLEQMDSCCEPRRGMKSLSAGMAGISLVELGSTIWPLPYPMLESVCADWVVRRRAGIGGGSDVFWHRMIDPAEGRWRHGGEGGRRAGC